MICDLARRLHFGIMERRALVRVAEDAHRALRMEQNRNRVLRDANEVLRRTSTCAGRVEHIRLAARAERYEALYEQRLDPTRTLTTIELEQKGSGDA